MVMPLVIIEVILNFIGAFGVNGSNVRITLFILVRQRTLFFTIIHNLSTLTVALTTSTKKLQQWSVILIHSVFTDVLIIWNHLGLKSTSQTRKSHQGRISVTPTYQHECN